MNRQLLSLRPKRPILRSTQLQLHLLRNTHPYTTMTNNSNTPPPKIPRAALIIGGTAVAMVAWPLTLGVFGWTAGGVAAGSVAAGIQAGIGNVAAGSAFALTQSAAMGGAVAGVVNGALAAVGAVGAAMAYSEDSKECKDCKKCEKCEKCKEEGEKADEEKTK